MSSHHLSPRGGILRPRRRPAGWMPPGPRPPEPPEPHDLWPAPGEDLCWIAGHFRILQRTDGHRFSLDDVLTAYFAAEAVTVRPPARTLDLGCGIGSVLLFTAWRFPQARCLGVEAQPISAALARRSLRWNAVDDRCRVMDGDLRDVDLLAGEAAFDLVTGTPPYFPRGTGVESDHVQKGPCRFEHRGGVEAYCAAAARLLAPGAPFVGCAPSGQAARVAEAAASAGLAVQRWQDVVPRAGKAPLVSLFLLRRTGEADARTDLPPLVVRDEQGRRTDEFVRARLAMGMPP